VHVPTWISRENALLFDRYLGPDWSLHPWHPDIIKRIDEIYNEELWRAHEMSRSRLISICRKLMQQQYERRNAPKAMMQEIESVLDHDALTIGFARRFATYKRANLLLQDPSRFEAIATSKNKPVQFIFAGKAHPADRPGQDLIRRICLASQTEGLRGRLIFLESYDMRIARHMVQGVDLWLNTPRRPHEASGTSGMKAAANGVLNCSILDGWWCEGYDPEHGWVIGSEETIPDEMAQDAADAEALYRVLQEEIIPSYYRWNEHGLPAGWIRRMKRSIASLTPRFSTARMVRAYVERYYAAGRTVSEPSAT
jgi:starch phosphorylase